MCVILPGEGKSEEYVLLHGYNNIIINVVFQVPTP